MPFARQRRAVPHCRTASKPLAGPQSDIKAVEIPLAVPGFRYLQRRLTPIGLAPSRFSPLTVLALSAAFCLGNSAVSQAKPSKSKASSTKKSSSKPRGVWAWTSGSQTYIRARPGIQTPPIAKVPRHTKLMVWGKFDGWYRVETTDHKFGWIHNELVNSAALMKIKDMSHSQARQASNKTSNQMMYGSVTELKKHYQRFGATGAKKGLAAQGVKVSPSNSQRLAAQKAAQVKLAQQKAAKAKATQAKLAAAKAAQQKTAQANAAKAAQAKSNQAKWVATKAAQEKAAQAKATQAKLAAAKAAQVKATQAKVAAKPTAKPVPVVAKVAPPAAPAVKTASGTPLQPVLPNPTVTAPEKVVTPAIPIPPKAASKTARKGNPQKPSITPEDLMRARQEHLKRSSSAPATEKDSDKASVKLTEAVFVPQVYYMTSAVYSPALAKGEGAAHFIPTTYTPGRLPSEQLAPRNNEDGPKSLLVPLNRSLPAAKDEKPEAAKVTVTVAKNEKKAPTKTASKGASKPAPSRGGSPRDLARATKNDFGQGVVTQALSYRGRPYVFGSSSPSRGFDCSGLIYHILRQRGLNPPRTAAGLASYGKPVPSGQLQAGDLVLFSNTYKRGISHVGIYTGNNNFVHAATSGSGVRVDSLGSPYYCRKYWGARRVEVKK